MAQQAAITKTPKFNPKLYEQEFTSLATENPAEAGKIARNVQVARRNLEDELREGSRTMMEVVGIAVGSVGALGVGYLDGGWEAKRDAMIADWEAGGAAEVDANLADYPEPWMHAEGGKDPTKIFGFLDKALGITLLTTAIAIAIGIATRDEDDDEPSIWASAFKNLAFGQFAYVVGALGRNSGYRRAKKKIEAAPAEE